MKKLFVLSLLLVAINVYAQDVIVQKNGTTIISKILEVGSTEIKYKKFSNPDGPVYSISKSDVISINYENGDKDLFSSPSESIAPIQANKNQLPQRTTAPEEYKLEGGTQIPLQNINYVRASQLYIGQTVNFRVSRDIKVDDVEIIPYGTIVKGKVYEAKKSSWFGTKGRLGIKIDNIELPDGITIPLTNGDVYVTGKNRTTLSVLLCLFVVWPACFITGSKAELPAGYEIVAQVANPVVFYEQNGHMVSKMIESPLQNAENNSYPRYATIKLKKSGYIEAYVQSEDNQYYYYTKASNPNGSTLKIKKSKVKYVQ